MAQRASADQQPASVLATGQASVFGRAGGQAGLAVALLTLAGAAWVATDLRMAGMDAGPGTDPGGLGFFISTWVVMMAAMMFPSVTPMALAYRDVQHQRRGRPWGMGSGGPSLFVGGYLAVWTAAGLAGYALLQAGRSLDGGLLAWSRGGRWLAAGVLVAAALYQLTPAKQTCSGQVPRAASVCPAVLARRSIWCAAPGLRAWLVVPGLLLGADGSAVCAWSHERGVDGARLGTDRGRASAPVAQAGDDQHRRADRRDRVRRRRSARAAADAHDPGEPRGDACTEDADARTRCR